MRVPFILLLFVGAIAAVYGFALVFGTPVMLSKQPDYSMRTSMVPVKELPAANDPDQTNARSEQVVQAAAMFADARSKQAISHSDDRKLLEKP